MEGVVEWVKNYSMVFLLMTILSSTIAKKEYRKYIQLFVEIILVLTLLNPILNLTGRADEFFERIAYDSFWQSLEEIRMDKEKMDFLNETYYITYYENAIEEDVKSVAEGFGYGIRDAEVTMNEEFEILKMEIVMEKEYERMENEEGLQKNRYVALKEKLAQYYQIDKSQITLID